ncbi:MAG TPA: hypothetical protein VMT30_03365 [Candidatus Saccharimonadia bacterium]|nr:hypothetical protein [Candidatus Saccharimonadia bacterium]
MKRLWLVMGMFLALVLAPAVALAAATTTGNVVLAKGDNRTGTYYAAGQTVTVDGNVAGDVVCAGQTVVINGTVGGDVLCAGQTVTVNGAVAGSVRSAGQVVTINASVVRNVTVASQNLVIGPDARVGGEVAAAGDTVALSGPVAQAVYSAGRTLSIDAPVGGSVTAMADELALGKDGRVTGNLDYTSSQTFTLDKGKISGQVVRHAPPQPSRGPTTAADRLTMLLYWIVAMLAGMLLAIWLAPRLVRSVTGMMIQRWEASLGWGAVAVVLAPIAILILAVTVVGLPAALFATALWVLVMISSGLFAGAAIGRLALRGEDDRRGLAMAALLGVPLVVLAGWVPVLGGLVGLVAAIWTAGGVVLAVNRARALG